MTAKRRSDAGKPNAKRSASPRRVKISCPDDPAVDGRIMAAADVLPPIRDRGACVIGEWPKGTRCKVVGTETWYVYDYTQWEKEDER